MSELANVLSSCGIFLVVWVFTAYMIDRTLVRKYSPARTFLRWVLCFIVFILVSGLLLELLYALDSGGTAAVSAFGPYIDLFLVSSIVLWFLFGGYWIYQDTPSVKIFIGSLYGVLALFLSDITSFAARLLFGPFSAAGHDLYFLFQAGLNFVLFGLFVLVFLPRCISSLRDMIRNLRGEMGYFTPVPLIVYLAYTLVACIWNSYLEVFLPIPELVIKGTFILLIALMYLIVVYGLHHTARLIRLDEEMRIAGELQRQILPSPADIREIRGADIAASAVPYRNIGGDFYDIFPKDSENIVVIIADVSGKGTPAAMIMAQAETILRLSVPLGADPGEILTRANDQLLKLNKTDRFVTVILGIFTPASGTFTYAGAGHPAPLLSGRGRAGALPVTKAPALGIRSHTYTSQEIRLEPDDLLFFYTDGLSDALGKDETYYGTERLQKILKKTLSSEGIIAAVTEDLAGFTQNGKITDDITMVALRYSEVSNSSKPDTSITSFTNP